MTEVVKDSEPEPAHQSAATVLLVEDDHTVREMAREMLELDGHSVLDAESSEDALRICENYKGEIDLLLTDVVMPGMGGAELVKQCAIKNRAMPVLYMSGYTDETMVRHGISGYSTASPSTFRPRNSPKHSDSLILLID